MLNHVPIFGASRNDHAITRHSLACVDENHVTTLETRRHAVARNSEREIARTRKSRWQLHPLLARLVPDLTSRASRDRERFHPRRTARLRSCSRDVIEVPHQRGRTNSEWTRRQRSSYAGRTNARLSTFRDLLRHTRARLPIRSRTPSMHFTLEPREKPVVLVRAAITARIQCIAHEPDQ